MSRFFFNKKILLPFFVSFLATLTLTWTVIVRSDSIEEQIEQKQDELNETNTQLKDISIKLEESQNQVAQLEDGIPKLEKEIEIIELEKEKISLEIRSLNESKNLKDLEKEAKQSNLINSADSSYRNWRIRESKPIFLRDEWDNIKVEQYGSDILGIENINIDLLTSDLKIIEEDLVVFEALISELEAKTEELNSQKDELYAELQELNNSIIAGESNYSNLLNQQNELQQDISFLSEEQQKANQREEEILEDSPAPSVPPIEPPEEGGRAADTFYITASGRDLYQGHGVGMSQWGAHGMALNGFNADEIATFYFAGTSISTGYESRSINVDGYGNMNIEDYVGGMAEVPSRACGNAEQVSENPSKYVLDNPNTQWDCWPEESIKAQAIAFRTYALNYIDRRGGSICTSTVCQVYNGGNASSWAAEETKGRVITLGGNPIEALYSSDNSQGFGTANNDTIFQNFAGDGSPYSYLRAVNDSAYATRTNWTSWQSQTGVYEKDQLNSMLNYASSEQSGNRASLRGYLSSEFNKIGGSVESLTMEKDPSNRVKKIWFKGDNGQQFALGGYWFKYIWNGWSYGMGYYDYVYSQTFNINF